MSKDLFMMLREQEIQTSNFLPNKKEIQYSAKSFIQNILDTGEKNKLELLAQSKRMADAIEVVTAEILKSLPQENFEAFGLKGTYRSGGEVLNYSEDEVYVQLKTDLDARIELLKLAQKQTIIDAYGNEVPKVSTTQRKDSLAITY